VRADDHGSTGGDVASLREVDRMAIRATGGAGPRLGGCLFREKGRRSHVFVLPPPS
jgi:hypothetical protein